MPGSFLLHAGYVGERCYSPRCYSPTIRNVGEHGEFFANYAVDFSAWRGVAFLGVSKRATATALHLEAAARTVCVSMGKD